MLEPDIVGVGGDTEKHQAIAIKQGTQLLQLLQHLVRLRVRGLTQKDQYHVAPATLPKLRFVPMGSWKHGAVSPTANDVLCMPNTPQLASSAITVRHAQRSRRLTESG